MRKNFWATCYCARNTRGVSTKSTLMANCLLKQLPSFNKDNFSRFRTDDHGDSLRKKPMVYLPTKESQMESQLIVTDKTNILLRYLRQQLHEKNSQNKRSSAPADSSSPSRKIPRLERADSSESEL